MSRFEQVDRRSGLSIREFENDYFNADRPVVVTDAAAQWKARLSWTFEKLKSRCGQSLIEASLYENGSYRPDRFQRMPLADYIDALELELEKRSAARPRRLQLV